VSGIQFQVMGHPINFGPDDYAGLSSGNAKVIWDIFTKKACEIYRDKGGESLGGSCELSKKGVTLVDSVITKEDVFAIKSILGDDPEISEVERSESPSNGSPYSGENTYTVKPIIFNVSLKRQINKLIYKIMSKKFVSDLEIYFQSFFSINHVMLSRAFPDPDPIVSFRWHRDAGPKMQTHIMVYLDDYETTGGRTEFVDYEDSLELEKIYSIAPSEMFRRVTDLSDIYPKASIIRPFPKSGDALIFNSTQIFHRGIHPEQAFRDVLFIILQPDIQPWSKLFPSERVFKYPSGTSLYNNHPFEPYITRV